MGWWAGGFSSSVDESRTRPLGCAALTVGSEQVVVERTLLRRSDQRDRDRCFAE